MNKAVGFAHHFQPFQRVHFVGVGGTGMCGLAEILVNLGYGVSGSDASASPTLQRLKKSGVVVQLGHHRGHVQGADVVVVSTAITPDNPEWIAAKQLNIPVIHRSEMLAEIIRLKYAVLVTGTHGKTTTTSLLGGVLQAAGLHPTVVVGGRVNRADANGQLGQGDFVVCEADESDGSFLNLSPTIAVVTNVDRDHLDYFTSLDHIIQCFEDFLKKVPFYGAICACADDPVVQSLLPKFARRVITFGFHESSDIRGFDVVPCADFHTSFRVSIFGQVLEQPVELPLPGRYNVTNALASFAVGAFLKIPPSVTAHSLKNFSGVLHRFTVVFKNAHVTIIDDYAHNPTKISSVLEGVRQSLKGARICAVFQPHRYSRVRHFFQDFAGSFVHADQVVVLPVYTAGEVLSPQDPTLEQVCAAIDTKSFGGRKRVVQVHNFSEACSAIHKSLGDYQDQHVVVITLGAGDIKNLGPFLAKSLKGGVC